MRLGLFWVFLLVLLLSGGRAHSSGQWRALSHTDRSIELNPLRFANRAECAKESENPNSSAFVLLNNIPVARALSRMSQAMGLKSKEKVKLGIDVYRTGIIEILSYIHKKILSGELPILPSQNGENSSLKRYAEISQSCRSDRYCHALDRYLKQVWQASHQSEYRLKLSNIDSFTESHFLETSSNSSSRELRCSLVRKFSPLQSPLFGVEPTQAVLTDIAKSAMQGRQVLGSCDESAETTNVKVALFQVEVRETQLKNWEAVGFDYWHSLKLYFSWAWRQAKEVEPMLYPFAHLFRSVTIEESLLLVPNGCRSLVKPKCTGEQLAMNSLRELAKKEHTPRTLDVDLLNYLPKGPQAELLLDPFTKVNDDILDLGSTQQASDWLDQFYQKYSRARGFIKSKLIQSVNFFNWYFGQNLSDLIVPDLYRQFRQLLERQQGLSHERVLREKNELYHLCAEYTFAAHKDYGFLRKDFAILQKTKVVDGILQNFGWKSIDSVVGEFLMLSKKVLSFCQGLHQRKIWKNDFHLDPKGYSPWYLEKVYERKIASKRSSRSPLLLTQSQPYLSVGREGSTGTVICWTASDCLRTYLQSLIALRAASQYAGAFWTLNQQVSSPSLFNPYVERNSCRVYDPWFKTRSLFFNFFADVAQAALVTVNPGFIFSRARLQPGRVVSFQELVNEGKIEYSPVLQKEKVAFSLVADFGPLVGVPCAISITENKTGLYDFYRFAGITAGACVDSKSHSLSVASASEIGGNFESGGAGCFSCQINFESVTQVVSHAAVKGFGGFFLVRAVLGLFKALSDPFNIPDNWQVRIDYVVETYRKFGEIPKKCVSPLKKGERCLLDPCEEVAANRVEQDFASTVEWIDSSRYGKTKVKVYEHAEPVILNTYYSAPSEGSFDPDDLGSCTTDWRPDYPASWKERGAI